MWMGKKIKENKNLYFSDLFVAVIFPVTQRVSGSAAWQADLREKSHNSGCIVGMRSRVATVLAAELCVQLFKDI